MTLLVVISSLEDICICVIVFVYVFKRTVWDYKDRTFYSPDDVLITTSSVTAKRLLLHVPVVCCGLVYIVSFGFIQGDHWAWKVMESHGI